MRSCFENTNERAMDGRNGQGGDVVDLMGEDASDKAAERKAAAERAKKKVSRICIGIRGKLDH